jgi:hypothetical protein
MNCVELRKSLVEVESASRNEQQAHLKDCAECSTLLADLKLISASAAGMRASEEPSPRVWNSIEIVLRQEGLIRAPRLGRSLIPSPGSRWGWSRWLVPAAAALLVVVGIYVRQRSFSPELARNSNPPVVSEPVSDAAIVGLNDDDLLQEVAQQTPDMKAQYADDLRHVNQYIQDAKGAVAANPNDEEARRSLMEAYQEKAMLFELAFDRSLP